MTGLVYDKLPWQHCIHRLQTYVYMRLLDSAVSVVTKSHILGTSLASLDVDMANAAIASHFLERFSDAGL